jgi:hypothetical protein
MKTTIHASFPSEDTLESSLGPSIRHWRLLWEELAHNFPNVRPEWKRSENGFGGYCIARKGDRALLYLIPSRLKFEAAIIMGEKAASIASADASLIMRRKTIAQAPRCGAGRTIRFSVESSADVADVGRLVQFKTARY